MQIITKIDELTNEELLDKNYIKDSLLNDLKSIEIKKCDIEKLHELCKKLWLVYENQDNTVYDEVMLKLDSILYQISCVGLTNEDAKIPECFEHAYFWHYFFSIAFPLASTEDESLCEMIQEQYPLQESWLNEVFKDEPLQLELDDKILRIIFELDEVKYSLDEEEIFALFDYDTLAKLTEDDEVLFMLLLPLVLNEYDETIEVKLFKMVEEFPVNERMYDKITKLLVKHVTTEV